MDHHPDQMTPLEEFTILKEENPEQAARLLRNFQIAVERLAMIHDEIVNFTAVEHQRIGQNPLTPIPREGENLGAVAAQYGTLFERYMGLGDTLNRILFLASAPDGCPNCEACAAERDGDEPDDR